MVFKGAGSRRPWVTPPGPSDLEAGEEGDPEVLPAGAPSHLGASASTCLGWERKPSERESRSSVYL